MSEIILGVGTTLSASLATLVIIYRRSFAAYWRDVWTQLAMGFILLTTGTLVEFLHSLGLGGVLVPLEDGLLRMMMTSIPLIAGSLFLVAGLATVIPEFMLSSRRLEQIGELIGSTSVSGFSQRAGSTQLTLSDTVRQVCSVLSPSRFVFMIWDPNDQSLKPVASSESSSSMKTLTAYDLRRLEWLNEAVINRCPVSFVCAAGDRTGLGFLFTDMEVGDRVVVFPICVDGELAGVLAMVFVDSLSVSDIEVRIASQTLDAACAKAESMKLAGESLRLASMKDVHSRLMRDAVEAQDFADFAAIFGDAVKRYIPFDMLSVCVVDESGSNMKRYSVMESGPRVYERGLSLPAAETAVLRMARTGQAEIAAKLDSARYRDDSWLSRCGFATRLSVPVSISGRVRCVVSFVSVTADKFDEAHLRDAQRLSGVFAIAAELAASKDRLATRTAQITGFWEAVAGLMENGDARKYLLNLPRQITSLMPVTCCALFDIDTKHDRLVPIAEYSRLNGKIDRGPSESISFDMIPSIRQTIEGGDARVFNLVDPSDRAAEVEFELSLGLPVRSAVVVPVSVSGKMRAVLILGEKRAWSRRSFTREDLAIAGIAGSQVSLSIAFDKSMQQQGSTGRAAAIRNIGNLDEAYSQFSRKLASPLSSILGAAELIERNLPNAQGPMIECVHTIRRNTDKAVRALADMTEYARTVMEVDREPK